MKLILFVVAFMVQILITHCYHNCGYKSALRWRHTASGRLDGYCMTDEIRPRQVPLHTDLDTKDCYNCRCTEQGLYCCGIGIKSVESDIRPPEGCQIFITGCQYEFRKLYDVHVPCYK